MIKIAINDNGILVHMSLDEAKDMEMIGKIPATVARELGGFASINTASYALGKCRKLGEWVKQHIKERGERTTTRKMLREYQEAQDKDSKK